MWFIKTPYNLIFKTNLNLSEATSIVIEHDDPIYKNSGQWTATADGKNARFSITASTIQREGTYNLQVIAVIDGLTRRSNVVQVNFTKSIFQ